MSYNYPKKKKKKKTFKVLINIFSIHLEFSK